MIDASTVCVFEIYTNNNRQGSPGPLYPTIFLGLLLLPFFPHKIMAEQKVGRHC